MADIDYNLVENELWEEDIQLFKEIEGQYVSNNEKLFFETLYTKMLTELAPCKELLISEMQNADKVYLLRDQYDEFILGQGIGEERKKEIHVMKLFDVLHINMRDAGFLAEDISFWEWLRRIDYDGVMYNHNYAYL